MRTQVGLASPCYPATLAIRISRVPNDAAEYSAFDTNAAGNTLFVGDKTGSLDVIDSRKPDGRVLKVSMESLQLCVTVADIKLKSFTPRRIVICMTGR